MKRLIYIFILLFLQELAYGQNNNHFAPGLIYPVNERLTFDQNPVFTWSQGQIVSSSQQNTFDVSYTITLVEVVNGQTPEMAIQRNFPVFKENAKTNALMIPTYAEDLKSGARYAWQVIMNTKTIENNEVVRPIQIPSRVNSFIYASTITYNGMARLEMKESNEAIYLLSQPDLNFEINQIPEKLYNVDFHIIDQSGVSVITEEIIPKKDCLNNTYHINLEDYKFFNKRKSKNQVLKLKARNSDGEVFTIPFVYE